MKKNNSDLNNNNLPENNHKDIKQPIIEEPNNSQTLRKC